MPLLLANELNAFLYVPNLAEILGTSSGNVSQG
jgi:hypothetical protein